MTKDEDNHPPAKQDTPDDSDKTDEPDKTEKLIEFFKTLKQRQPRPDQVDYSSWDQTEEAYQKQQADWLEKVKQNKGRGKE